MKEKAKEVGGRFREWLKNRDRKKRRSMVMLRWGIFLGVVLLAIFSYLTNPFVRFSVITDPYTTVSSEDGEFELKQNYDLIVAEDPFFKQLALAKAGWHIFSSKVTPSDKSPRTTVDEIIKAIHLKRFDPKEPFLISGDHFSVFYPRSLGIFYHSLLDPRTALDATDWANREKIYLKTEAYALQVFSQSDRLATTVVPISPRSVVLLDIYAPPSDTLYSILYGLKVLESEDELLGRYPVPGEEESEYQLSTDVAARELLEKYWEPLVKHWKRYRDGVYDKKTGLVRRDILLSGAKDISKREGAFYDNVIFWRTNQLMQELGLIAEDREFLESYKQRIIDTYWNEGKGIFIEDLSNESIEQGWYSSDWLIAYQTGFLDVGNEKERKYLERGVEYIQRNALDKPFGLQYHADPRPERMYGIPRLMAPSYGSTAIWSNWGMEYTKLLVRLAEVTREERYLNQAGDQLAAYAYNIKRYRGYPEVYDAQGDFFRQRLYTSVRQTGWVVSYQQAQVMYEGVRKMFESGE